MAKRKRTRKRKPKDASTDKPSPDSSASESEKKGGESASRPSKRAAKSGRRPTRRRNRDDEILEHRWEVVSDDSSGGRSGGRSDGRRRDRAGQGRGKGVEGEQAGKDKKTQREEKEKRTKKSKTIKEAKPSAEKSPRSAATDEPGDGKRKAKRRKRVKKTQKQTEPAAKEKDTKKKEKATAKQPAKKQKQRPADATPESKQDKPDKKKQPARKRRKKKAAEEIKPIPETKPAPKEKPIPKEKPAAKEKPAPVEKKRPKRRKKKSVKASEQADRIAQDSPPEETPDIEEQPVEKKPPAEKKPRAKRKKKSHRPEAGPKVEDEFPIDTEGGFWDMELSRDTQAALRAADYLEPTPVQAGLIPKAITGVDLMGQARTGTGKTAAFAIPILEQIETGVKKRGPQALVLVPTRELAVQVRDECDKLAVNSKARVVAVYGGKPIRRQMEKIKRGAEVVVGTPGRVMDHMARGTLFLGDLKIVVLDEADRMLDIGFRPDIEKILRKCPQSRQTLLLSATLPPPVKRLARQYMHEPEVLDFSPKDVAVDTIEQFYFTVDAEKKFDLLVKLLKREDPAQAIIFCRTRRGTEKIYRRLSRKEKGAACIHGDLQQSTRDRVMKSFREGKVRLLLATDVVGRGIDVTGVSHIINYDTPEFCDDYVHRVGRTGRMGREGVAYSFVTPEEGSELTRIEMRINRLLKRDEIEGFEPSAKQEDEHEPSKPDPKPVYGRPTKRIRRAL